MEKYSSLGNKRLSSLVAPAGLAWLLHLKEFRMRALES